MRKKVICNLLQTESLIHMRKFKEPTTYCQFVLVAVERQKFLQMCEGHFADSIL